MELIIEQVSRSQKLLHRYKIKGSTIAIGRAYDNDIILNDPYVCPHHLGLDVNDEGRWAVSDQGSVNGCFSHSQQPLSSGQPIQSGDVISIGKSYLRFIYPNQPVAPAMPLGGFEGLLNRLSAPSVVILIMGSYLGLLLANYYLHSFAEIKSSQMLSAVFSRFIVMSLLPLLFGFIARMFKCDARILSQMAVCYSFFILFMLFSGLTTLLQFNSSQPWLSQSFANITEIGLVFSLLWVACYVAFHQDATRRTITAAGVTLGLVVLGYIYDMGNSSDFNPKPTYDNTLLVPEFALSPPVTIEAFISKSEIVFAEASAAVER